MFLRFRFVLLLAIALPCIFISCNKDDDPYDVIVDFQNVSIPDVGYNNVASGGSFQEGIVSFKNYQPEGYWYGFAYSQMHDLATFDYSSNEFSAYVLNDRPENKFMVGFVSTWDAESIEISFSQPVKDLSFDVANSTLAALAMKGEDPSGFARKFENGDEFLLLIQLYDANDNPLFVDENNQPKLEEIPLAQGTSILNSWMNIQISGNGQISKIEFSLSSTDSGEWGMNTPAYFCIDNIKARTVK